MYMHTHKHTHTNRSCVCECVCHVFAHLTKENCKSNKFKNTSLRLNNFMIKLIKFMKLKI